MGAHVLWAHRPTADAALPARHLLLALVVVRPIIKISIVILPLIVVVLDLAGIRMMVRRRVGSRRTAAAAANPRLPVHVPVAVWTSG